jgi:hypothetical protein
MAYHSLIILALSVALAISAVLWLWVFSKVRYLIDQRYHERELIAGIVDDVQSVKADIKSLTSNLNKV